MLVHKNIMKLFWSSQFGGQFAPTIFNTFLESYQLKNKRIVLFPTSGSSGFGSTAKELKPSVDASTTIEEGIVTHSKSNKQEVEGWVKKFNL